LAFAFAGSRAANLYASAWQIHDFAPHLTLGLPVRSTEIEVLLQNEKNYRKLPASFQEAIINETKNWLKIDVSQF
jgi:hypothetical protein